MTTTVDRRPDGRIERGTREPAPARVIVNGEERALAAGTTLGDLLRTAALDPRMVVIEYNRVIQRDRAALDAVILRDGDALEIVHFVGGG